MNLKDCNILQKCYDDAVKHMQDIAVTAVEEYINNGSISDDTIKAYKISLLGVASTRKDLEYCLDLEIQEINGEMHA